MSKRLKVANSQSKSFGIIPYVDPKSFSKCSLNSKSSKRIKAASNSRSKRFKRQNKNQRSLNKKSDIYSIGVLFWEISSGRPPFYNEGKPYDIGLAIEILQGFRETPVIGTPDDYVKIYTGKYN